MMKIALLDCTLRDGGYVNEFNFSARQVRGVTECLVASGIEYIEAGFLRDSKKPTETTVFTDVSEINTYLPESPGQSSYFLMVVYGKFAQEKFPPRDQVQFSGVRVTFKKQEIDEALTYCRALIEKGYDVSANPTGINAYSDMEILALVEKINDLNPFCFSIVDTLGVLQPQHLLRIYGLLENNLNESIAIGFHSHNNLQLSFANALSLINLHPSRLLIIDSCLFGMGRGAGNLSTELMVQHLNTLGVSNYRILPIIKAIDEQIAKIHAVRPWGYNIPYYLAASVRCHPNYASYLIEKQTISVEAIHAVLQRIPDNKKSTYDKALIKQLYFDYQQHTVDDSAVLSELRQRIGERPVLLLAPGKSITKYESSINEFIHSRNPYVFSLNFTPRQYLVDTVFISNAKRYEEQKGNPNLLVTSNVQATGISALNYASYLNNSEIYDNAALMLMAALMSIGVQEVWLAGMDGFTIESENYADAEMINRARLGVLDKRNSIMQEMLKRYSAQICIHFITPSLYEVSHEV